MGTVSDLTATANASVVADCWISSFGVDYKTKILIKEKSFF